LSITNKAVAILKTTFVSLKYKNFRYFWIGQCVSLTGTWMQRTAQLWLVYTITKSPFLVGLLGVCQFMPMLLFTLFAGVFVDRFPKKNILLFTQALFMLQAVILTLLTFTGVVKYWHILVLSAFFGLTQTVDMPARQSFFIELVGKEDVMNSISLNSTIVNLARIVGPAVSGIVMLKFGITFCFFINAVSYIAVILGLLLIKMNNSVPQRIRRHVLQEIVEGLQYIKKSETLIINVLFMSAVCTFAMNNDVIIPVFAKTVLKMGANGYTGLMTAAGVGSFVAAIVMAFIAKNGVKKGMLIIAGVATAFIQILMFLAGNYFVALFLTAIIGFINLTFINVSNSIFQIHTTDEYRGRVMSVYSFLNQGSTPVGNFYAGSVMQQIGGRAGFPACGAATLLFLVPVFVIKRKAIISWLER
jgi:MFS family permease